MKTKITLAVQKSGRLADATMNFLQSCGFRFSSPSRALMAPCSNFPLELLFFRSKDIPQAVEQGIADMGICGQDVVHEKGKQPLSQIEALGFGKCRMSLAAPSTMDMEGKRIATSFPRILRDYLEKEGKSAKIIELSGSVEIAPSLNMADAICDIVSTGSTLQQNGLIELEEVARSEAILFGKEDVKTKLFIDDFLLRVRSAIRAKKSKYIVMNAPKSAIDDITKILPGISGPTISQLAKPDWVSIASVVGNDMFWETIKSLKEVGAEGILEIKIDQFIE